MALRAALNGKIITGRFTGLTGTTITIAFDGTLGRVNPLQSAVSLSIIDASDDATFSYRITSFTSSQIVFEVSTALVADDVVLFSLIG